MTSPRMISKMKKHSWILIPGMSESKVEFLSFFFHVDIFLLKSDKALMTMINDDR